jgi:hypothetical protein
VEEKPLLSVKLLKRGVLFIPFIPLEHFYLKTTARSRSPRQGEGNAGEPYDHPDDNIKKDDQGHFVINGKKDLPEPAGAVIIPVGLPQDREEIIGNDEQDGEDNKGRDKADGDLYGHTGDFVS